MALNEEKVINKLKKRILDISFSHKLSHIGSCLTALPIICEIYEQKKEQDIFILSSGHAGVALYVVLESKYGYDAEKLYEIHGVHPNRDIQHKIYASSGSLGSGILLAAGMAISHPNIDVFCLCSDGETFEGSFLEAIRFARRYELNNFKVYINCNGWSAYDKVDIGYLEKELKLMLPTIQTIYTNSDLPFCQGMASHYHIMSEEDYKKATNYIT